MDLRTLTPSSCLGVIGAVTCAVVLLAACTPPTPGGGAAPADDPSDPRSTSYRPEADASTEVHEVPETGISLGWGWNSVTGEPVPSICVEFVEGTEPAQTRFITMHEVSDSYDLMRTLGMSAEASVSTIGFEVSGKASFAKDLHVSRFASNFVMNAHVENGVRYAAPAPANWRAPGADPAMVGPRGGRQGEIRLTPEALRLARNQDPAEFIHRCGHGFVSAVYSGAKLSAVITVNTSSQAEHEAVSAEVSGNGWGARFKGSMSQSSGTTTENKDLNISIFQTGGRGDSIPVTKDDVLARLDMLSAIAFDAPKDFHMSVAPYETLANWPASSIEVESDEYAQVASLWGAYNSLYGDIQAVLDAPAAFVGPIEDATGCVAVKAASGAEGLGAAQVARLKRVQDEVLAALRRLRNFAQFCAASNTGCEFPEGEFRSPYAYRIQLPLEAAHGGSLADVLLLHVADAAKRRCAEAPDGIGCLTNAEIDGWREKIGMDLVTFDNIAARDVAVERLRAMRLEGMPATCPGQAGAPGPAFSAEPGFPALWYVPRIAACVANPDQPASRCSSPAAGKE